MNALKHILVVDDETNVRLTVAQMLRVSGYEVHAAESGGEAVALAAARDLDLVLSDIRLPEMDGYDTFRAIRAVQHGVRGVAMTGFADVGSESAALDAGFHRLIRKPFTFQALLEAVESALQAGSADGPA